MRGADEPASARSTRALPDVRPSGTLSGLIGTDLSALQRLAGNRAVVRYLQRDPNASTPRPNSTQPPDPELLTFEGHKLRFDANVLYPLLRDMAEQKGLAAPASFVGRLRTAPPTFLSGSERPGLLQDVIKGLDDANTRLDFERAEFVTKFETTANAAALALLENSEKAIKAELERLGISGQIERGPQGGYPNFKLGNPGAAAALKTAAATLLPMAKTAEETARASGEASRKLGQAQRDDPFNLLTKSLIEEDNARRSRWLEALDPYEKQRRTSVAAAPGLALYTEEPGVSGKLAAVSTLSEGEFANDIGVKANHRLDNIKQVKGEVGKRFTVWSQSHLQHVTLDQMQASRTQRESVDWEVQKRRQQSADDKLMFALIAIGLGIVSAIPTGGSGLLAGISAAAGIAGAGLSLYQVGEEASEYSLALAATATDFDKAKAISRNDPNGLQLALDCLMAVGDVFAAAAAFKALGGVVKAVKAGDVRSAIKLAEVAEGVGVRGAAKSKIIGEAAAGLSGEAIESVAKTMSGGLSREAYMQKLITGLGEHSQLKGELQGAVEMMEHVRGRIPDAAREMVTKGRVKVFNEASLIDIYGAKKGAAKWKKLDYAGGFYDSKRDLMFIRPGNSSEDLAGTLIHEATHRLGNANPLRGNNFMSEAVAEFAERDFYLTLYAEGGPLAGQGPKSQRIQQFLSWSDDQLMHNIETRYFAAKQGMDPAQRAAFKNIAKESPDEVVRQIFDDIAADYQARLPVDDEAPTLRIPTRTPTP